MAKEKKATRKFKQQKLKGELERRKKVKDFKVKTGKKNSPAGHKGGKGAAGAAAAANGREAPHKATESEKNTKK